jgi:hypothetical protein
LHAKTAEESKKSRGFRRLMDANESEKKTRWCPEESYENLAKSVGYVKSGTNVALDIPLLFLSVSHLKVSSSIVSAVFTDGGSMAVRMKRE